MGERRSGNPAQAWVQLDVLGEADQNPMPAQRVGARPAPSTPSPPGGGYLDECIPPEVAYGAGRENFAPSADSTSRDEQLIAELAAMGLPRVMLTMAEELGFDSFMRCWHILDSAPEVHSKSGCYLIVNMPRLRAYHRYQRNRFIETLAAMGQSQRQIQTQVKARLGETLSDRHTRRLMDSRRVKA